MKIRTASIFSILKKRHSMKLSFGLVFLFVLTAVQGASAQTWRICEAQTSGMPPRAYFSKVFADPLGTVSPTSGSDPYTEKLATNFKAELLREYPGLPLDVLFCNRYNSQGEAQALPASVANAYGGALTVYNVAWGGGDSGSSARYILQATGRGASETVALAAAKSWAIQSYPGKVATFGTNDCSSVAGRDPLWFCAIDFWVPAPYTVLKDTQASSSGMGRTKTETIASVKQSALSAYPGEISRWTSIDCKDVPTRQPRWSCTLGFEVQVPVR